MGLKALVLGGCLGLALMASGCGYRGSLTRIADDPAAREAVRSARTEERAAVARGLTPTAEQRPIRVDDISIRVDDRASDPFNLPPE